jgi:hypothetical protein
MVKLNATEVQQVRDLYRAGYGLIPIAKRFGVTFANVRCIVKGWTWSHLPDVPAEVPTMPGEPARRYVCARVTLRLSTRWVKVRKPRRPVRTRPDAATVWSRLDVCLRRAQAGTRRVDEVTEGEGAKKSPKAHCLLTGPQLHARGREIDLAGTHFRQSDR